MKKFLIAILLFFLALPAFAQDSEQEDRSFFLNFVESKLSTPNRQIRINNIQGVLSSNAVISEITIADREGVWLRIVNARIDWQDALGIKNVVASLFARNVFDKVYQTAATGLNNTLGISTKQFGEPRVVGLSLSFDY